MNNIMKRRRFVLWDVIILVQWRHHTVSAGWREGGLCADAVKPCLPVNCHKQVM
jgi:hypothetical protein